VNVRLLKWYTQHGRDLPWRRMTDPYNIWVSEVMLQQTQVATVLPYYERWIERFPTLEVFASSDEQTALSLWQGLGYYRRCKLFLQGARHVVSFGWPSSAEEWMKVPGVGRYTACAIASICLGEASPVVDGNVERVFARLTACADGRPVLTERAYKWGLEQISRKQPAQWNQAIMELGATICKPRNPDCGACPLRSSCKAYRLKRVEEFPAKKARAATRSVSADVLVPFHRGKFGVRQIEEGRWSEGLWEFPSSDMAGERCPLGRLRHTVTRHEVSLDVSLLRCAERAKDLRWVTVEELEEIPMPSPQRKALRLAREALHNLIPIPEF